MMVFVGSIAFVSLSMDNAKERFGFVVLDDLPPGTTIYFTNGHWNGSSFTPHIPPGGQLPGGGGATIAYTVPPGGVKAGAYIQISPGVGWWQPGDPVWGMPDNQPRASDHLLGSTVTKEGYWDMGWGDGSDPTGTCEIYAWVHDGLSNSKLFLTAISAHSTWDPTWLDGTLLSDDHSLWADPTAHRIGWDPTGGGGGSDADVFCIDQRLVAWRDAFNRPITDPEVWRREVNRDFNWIRDGGVNDGAMNPDGSAADRNNPEGDALTDPNSPLRYKTFYDQICFMPGTLIRTPAEELPVETLAIGDEVLTSAGEVRPVKWIGRQTVSTVFGDPLRVLPIRIQAGSLAENVPCRDLFVSADHALLVGGVLINAGALVNGTTITRARDVPATFTYYHVELYDHSLILAENTPAETFVDNVERLAFDNWAEHEALYPDARPMLEMTYPRAKSARQVPQAIRDGLARRAAAAYGRPAVEAA